MATSTMSLISKQTVGAAGAASVTFSNIPQTYTDLKLVISARKSATGVDIITVAPNNNTSSLTGIYLDSNNTGTPRSGSLGTYAGLMEPSDYTSNTFGSMETYFPNYTSSNYKSFSTDSVLENNAAGDYLAFNALLWSSTAAITSLVITTPSANFVQYSTFSLYGISKSATQNVSVPYALGGDVITTDGTYWYHAFLYSGNFTPKKALTCDVLVVAGGGGGGSNRSGGGGGAGGLLAFTSQSLSTAAAAIVVGGGGAGASASTGPGTNGQDSQFQGLTLVKGGGGGGSGADAAVNPARTGATGGSGGGGGGWDGGGSNAGGTATSGQGNSGSASAAGPNYPSGGGGGATAAGATVTGSSTSSASGGTGSTAYSTWASATTTGASGYYAGGGGGGGNPNATGAGAGGSGGGGGGGSNTNNGTNGTANTGGGGGGSGLVTSGTGSNGGSGIVIVRYTV